MTLAGRVGAYLLLGFVVAACGTGQAAVGPAPAATLQFSPSPVYASPSPSPTPSPVPSPTAAPPTAPPVLPKDVFVHEAHTWTAMTTKLGDPYQLLAIDLTSNSPHRFLAHVGLEGLTGGTIDGPGCSGFTGCPLFKSLHLETNCKGTCAGAKLTLSVWICSYKDPNDQPPGWVYPPCSDQDGTWLNYIGDLGVNLKGNPAAEPASGHPAVTELSYTFHIAGP